MVSARVNHHLPRFFYGQSQMIRCFMRALVLYGIELRRVVVEILCTLRAKAVDNRTAKFFSARDPNDRRECPPRTHPSRVASLDLLAPANKIVGAPTPIRTTQT